MPFDVAPPSWLDAQPQIEQANFVTWEAPDLPAVRFLAPVNVYRPGDTTATEVPSDYVGYLLGQARNGGHFADQVEEDIDGRPATLATATTDRALDGSMGCPTATTSAAECFGLQPDLVLRIAAVNVHDQTLLIWLRMDKNTDRAQSKARIRAFEDMLATVRFSDREPAPETASASPTPDTSPIDGNYQMSISWPRTKTADARCVGGLEGTADRSVYELSLDRGLVQLSVRIGGPSAPLEPAFSGTFRVHDKQLDMEDEGVPVPFAFSYDGHELTLTALKELECGGRAIWTTKPWIRQ